MVTNYVKTDFSICLETFRNMQSLRLPKLMHRVYTSFIATQRKNLLKTQMLSCAANLFTDRQKMFGAS